MRYFLLHYFPLAFTVKNKGAIYGAESDTPGGTFFLEGGGLPPPPELTPNEFQRTVNFLRVKPGLKDGEVEDVLERLPLLPLPHLPDPLVQHQLRGRWMGSR